MYLDGSGNFFEIFVQKYFFTLVKNILGQKNHFFDDFSKIRFLAKNLTI